MITTEKVKRTGIPTEPWGKPGDYGHITKTASDGNLRITPASRTIPAQAYVHWNADADDGGWFGWTRLADLKEVGVRKTDVR